MNNPNDVVQNKHLDALAARIATFLSGDDVDTEDPDAIKISIGDFRFQFTGVIDGLTLHENNFYAANDSSHSTPLGSVTQSVVDGKTKFDFNLYHGAIDVAQTTTVSCGKLTPNVDFDFTITPETIFKGGWRDNQNGTYSYVTDGYQGVATKNDQESTNGKISYTFTNSIEQPQQFTITLGQHDENGFFVPRTDDASVQWGFGDISSVAIEITRNETTGHIQTASATLNSGSLPAKGFSEDTVIKLDWTTDSSYGEAKPKTSVKIDETYLKTLTTSTTNACKFEPQTTESGSGSESGSGTEGTTYKGTTYTFTANEITAGYMQNDSTVSFTAAKGGDTFTITNLASGLWVDYNNIFGCYDIFSRNGILVGTIAETMNPDTNCYDVEILDKAALFTTAPSETFTVKLTDTDDKHEKKTYYLKFAEKLTQGNDSIAATFTTDSQNDTKYIYAAGITGWKFTPNASEQTANNQLITSYTYKPSTNSNIPSFYLAGLKSGLTDLNLVPSSDTEGVITATVDGVADTQIATYNLSTKSIYIHDNALPSADHDWLVTSDYDLRFADSHTQYSGTNTDRISITNSNGEYTCSVTSSGDKHVLRPINWQSLAYRKSRLGKSFTVSGLCDDLGALTFETPNFKTANNVVVAKMKDLTFVVNADALPLNPDNNTVIELTNNTGGFSLELADDVVKRNFANEKFTHIGAGNYTYSASGSTVGWFVDGGKIFYNATELNGTTFTLTGLRTDLGALTFNADGNIHAKNGGIVGKMIRNQITWNQHALLIPSTPVVVQ